MIPKHTVKHLSYQTGFGSVRSPKGIASQRDAGRSLRDCLACEKNRPFILQMANLVADAWSLLINACHLNSRAKHTPMCTNYGHVIRGGWKRGLPKCDECGATIKDASELRTAEAKMPRR